MTIIEAKISAGITKFEAYDVFNESIEIKKGEECLQITKARGKRCRNLGNN